MGREHIRIPSDPIDIDVVTDDYMKDAGNVIGSNRMLSICRALGQVYVNTEDEEVKRKLRYASTLARYYIYKLREFDPEWAKNFCPRFRDFDTIMREK